MSSVPGTCTAQCREVWSSFCEDIMKTWGDYLPLLSLICTSAELLFLLLFQSPLQPEQLPRDSQTTQQAPGWTDGLGSWTINYTSLLWCEMKGRWCVCLLRWMFLSVEEATSGAVIKVSYKDTWRLSFTPALHALSLRVMISDRQRGQDN